MAKEGLFSNPYFIFFFYGSSLFFMGVRSFISVKSLPSTILSFRSAPFSACLPCIIYSASAKLHFFPYIPEHSALRLRQCCRSSQQGLLLPGPVLEELKTSALFVAGNPQHSLFSMRTLCCQTSHLSCPWPDWSFPFPLQ